jgi:indolepyruvate ferredoxin oxidoreductase
MMKLMGLLSRFKVIRGSWLDPFKNNPDRKLERSLISEYEQTLEILLTHLTNENVERAIAIARLPEQIRGFGHIKQDAVKQVALQKDALLEQFLAQPSINNKAA